MGKTNYFSVLEILTSYQGQVQLYNDKGEYAGFITKRNGDYTVFGTHLDLGLGESTEPIIIVFKETLGYSYINPDSKVEGNIKQISGYIEELEVDNLSFEIRGTGVGDFAAITIYDNSNN